MDNKTLRADLATPEGRSDKVWINYALDSFASVEPKEKSADYVRAREAYARKLVREVARQRVPSLIVALFESYDSRKENDFVELMWLVEALYSALPKRVQKDQACAILAVTRHSCGHGGIEEPIKLAKASFEGSSYTPEFFQALRTYRDRLVGLHSAEVTRVLGEIAQILWQDPQEPLRPRHCLSASVRERYFALENDRRDEWSQLLRYVDRTARRRPDKKWTTGASLALQKFGGDTFARDFAGWLTVPAGSVPLSTGGRHVLKTLIWLSALTNSSALDNVLPQLIDLDYTKPKAAVHLVYAVGYWLESRPPEFADEHRQRLRAKWPIAGARIRG
jgi:hypothetical protein